MSNNNIPDGDIDAESPLTESLMTRLRDNPIAIAQASAGDAEPPRVRSTVSGPSAIASDGIAGAMLTVTDDLSPDGFGRIVRPITPAGRQFSIRDTLRESDSPLSGNWANTAPLLIWEAGVSAVKLVRGVRPDLGGQIQVANVKGSVTHYAYVDLALQVSESSETVDLSLNWYSDSMDGQGVQQGIKSYIIPSDNSWTTIIHYPSYTSQNISWYIRARVSKSGGDYLIEFGYMQDDNDWSAGVNYSIAAQLEKEIS